MGPTYPLGVGLEHVHLDLGLAAQARRTRPVRPAATAHEGEGGDGILLHALHLLTLRLHTPNTPTPTFSPLPHQLSGPLSVLTGSLLWLASAASWLLPSAGALAWVLPKRMLKSRQASIMWNDSTSPPCHKQHEGELGRLYDRRLACWLTYLIELLLAERVQAPSEGEDHGRDRVAVLQDGGALAAAQPDQHQHTRTSRGQTSGRGALPLPVKPAHRPSNSDKRPPLPHAPVPVEPELLVLLEDGEGEVQVLLDGGGGLVHRVRQLQLLGEQREVVEELVQTDTRRLPPPSRTQGQDSHITRCGSSGVRTSRTRASLSPSAPLCPAVVVASMLPPCSCFSSATTNTAHAHHTCWPCSEPMRTQHDTHQSVLDTTRTTPEQRPP